MGDYRNTEQIAHSGIDATLSLDSDTLGVLKATPGGVEQASEYGWELGNRNPVTHIAGANTPSDATFTVAAHVWQKYIVAHPKWLGSIVDAFYSLNSPDGLPTLTYQNGRSKIVSAKQSELSTDGATQATVDITLKPLSVAAGGQPWS